jgi:bifunctional DNase/RNase
MKAVSGRHLCLLLIAAVVAACSCGRSPSTSALTAAGLSPDEVKVQVARVGFDAETGSHYVLLLDETESRQLPIMIGENEAQAIMLALHGIKPERPFTHDLIRSIIGQTGNRVDRIVIADMRDEIYYATISMDGGRYSIDSRPSDAIALAMVMNAPIYVNNKLFGSAPTLGLGAGGKIPDTVRALGLTVEQLTPDLASAFGQPAGRGVLVSGVSSSAEKAGVARGDIVVKVGDREVTALDDFSRQAAQLKSGGAVMLTLKRGGSNRTVTLENRPAGYLPKP